jgi:hypothetical protein
MNHLPDPRRAAFHLVTAGVAAGLPIPQHTAVGDTASSHGDLTLYLSDNDQAAVERWASWLGLPAPEMTLSPIKSSLHETGWFQPYAAPTRIHPATGHGVTVKTYVTVPAVVELAGDAA